MFMYNTYICTYIYIHVIGYTICGLNTNGDRIFKRTDDEKADVVTKQMSGASGLAGLLKRAE